MAIPISMESAELPPCKSREILKARLRADLKVYADAIAALQQNMGKNFEKFHQRAESSRRIYQAARDKFNEHVESHGCA